MIWTGQSPHSIFFYLFIFLDFLPDTHTAEWYTVFGFHVDGYIWYMVNELGGIACIPKGKIARRFL
jgi:hypothetical protein